MNTMSDDGDRTCPLCMEEMDLTDQQLKPCKCGYEICVWCWHHIMEISGKDDAEGRCPACRTPYDKEKIVGMTVSCDRVAELNSEKKHKSQKAKSKTSEGRKHLNTVRVVQRNLVYIVGLAPNLADEETLQRKELFGQYGKILKVSISRNAGATHHSSSNSYCSVYITYSKEEEAIRCIQVVNGYVLDGKPLRASFGTTKYCYAWLRNMPCGNPDCLYLHDSGTQEDSFIKDDMVSTCASKLQQSPGSVVNHTQRRSGSFLPPPIDDLCSDNNVTLGKPLVKLVLHSTGGCAKNSLPNVDTGKPDGLPAASSWGLRVSPSRPSITSTSVIQGPAKDKPSVSTSYLMSSNFMEAQVPAQTCDTGQHDEPALRNHSTFSNGKLERDQTNLMDPQVEPSIEPATVVKSTVNESSCFYSQDDVARGIIPLPCSVDSYGFDQTSSIPLLDMGVNGHSSADETAQNLFPILHKITDNKNAVSEGLSINENNLISNSQHCVATRPLDFPVEFSLQDSPSHNVEALMLGPLPGAVLTSEGVPLLDEQSCGRLKTGIQMSATDLEAKSISLTSDAKRIGISRGGLIMDLKVENIFSSSATGSSTSPKAENEKFYSDSSGYGHIFKYNHMESRSYPISSGDTGSQNSNSCKEADADADAGENSIISDILSLELGLDDPSVSPHNLANLILGDHNRKTGCSKLFSPWKSCSSNESRFSFARMQDSSQVTENAYSFNTHGYGHKETSDQKVIVESKGVHVNKYPNGIAVYDSGNSEILYKHPQLSSNEVLVLPPISKPKVSPPPRLPVQNKSPFIPPPGFYSQHAADRDQSFSTLHSSGSTSQYQFLGNSARLGSPQQITGNSSYGDVDFIDPAIMVASRGKLPLSTANLISPNYNSNLVGFTEFDQRLQLLKSRSITLNRNSMMAMDQSKYNLLQDMALQEAMRSSSGSWGGWNMSSPTLIESGLLARRGQSSLAEITNSGRVGFFDSQYGFLRPFPAREGTKFQTPNTGCFYSPAYEM